MGRVQVRIYGIHGQNIEEIPDEVLPWAQVLTPVTEGGISNLGNFLGIQIDARVFGIFLDGKNSQMPLVMGSIPHSEKGTTSSGKKKEVTTNANAIGTTADKESVEEPVSEFTIASNFLEMLKNLTMIGNNIDDRSSILTPSIKIEKVSVSGK